jgi:hypothetical protein
MDLDFFNRKMSWQSRTAFMGGLFFTGIGDLLFYFFFLFGHFFSRRFKGQNALCRITFKALPLLAELQAF